MRNYYSYSGYSFYNAVNVITKSIDFPADDTQQPLTFTVNEKKKHPIMISYHLSTVGTSTTRVEALICNSDKTVCG